MEVDLSRVRPYGDTTDDGAVQLSFTLPVPPGRQAEAAALKLVEKMGFQDARIVMSEKLSEDFSFFIVYGACTRSVDYTSIQVPELRFESMTFYEVNQFIRENIGRKVVVVGACTGSDAHTVGLDAILNMKGYAGEYGLERYPEMKVFNLGSQVSNEELVARAIKEKADALLVSQVVTQKNVHIRNLTELIELLEGEGIRDDILAIAGGPRITHELAVELGYDAGFGRRTIPPDVASFIVQELKRRQTC